MNTTHRTITPKTPAGWECAIPAPGSDFARACDRAARLGVADRYAARIESGELTPAQANRAFYKSVEASYAPRMELVRAY